MMDPEDVFGNSNPLFKTGLWTRVFNLMQEAPLTQEPQEPAQVNNVVIPCEVGTSNSAKAAAVNEAEQRKLGDAHEGEQADAPTALQHDEKHAAIEEYSSSVVSDDELDIDGLYERFMQAQAAADELDIETLGFTADTVHNTTHDDQPPQDGQAVGMVIDGPMQPQQVVDNHPTKRKRGRPPKASTPKGENPKPQNARDFQLPPGWRTETRVRKNGRSAGQKDTYYVHSITHRTCRSRQELNRYLKHQERRLSQVEEAASILEEMSHGLR